MRNVRLPETGGLDGTSHSVSHSTVPSIARCGDSRELQASVKVYFMSIGPTVPVTVESSATAGPLCAPVTGTG